MPCSHCGHAEIAIEIYKLLGEPKIYDKRNHMPIRGESALEKLGFVKLTGIKRDSNIIFPDNWGARTTPAQIAWLKRNYNKLGQGQYLDLDEYLQSFST